MTQKKLEILGPYTPDHDGPFCTRDGCPVELKFRDGRGDYPIGGYMGEEAEEITTWSNCGAYNTSILIRHKNDLMNAREVPVAREFWVNEYRRGDGLLGLSNLHEAEAEAIRQREELPGWNWTRTIRVREVLLGDE